MALGKLAESGSSRMEWSEVEQRLASLLEEFGPPRRGGPKPEYPFTRLRSDMVRELSRDVPMDQVSPLRSADVSGQFVNELEEYFHQNTGEIFSKARILVEQQYPTSVATEVLTAVGLDPDGVFAYGAGSDPAVERRRRSAVWRSEILQAWDRSCAFCGFDGQIGGGPVGLEAAHIRWFNFGGPDSLDNGLALCSLHHKLLDRGVIGFSDPETVVVSNRYSAQSEAGKRIYELHLKTIRPRPGTQLPAEEHVMWHVAEVFKGAAISRQ